MIGSPTGYIACYRNQQERAENKRPRYRPVVTWSPDGEALVMLEDHVALRPASEIADFETLKAVEEPVVGTLPANGWRVTYPQSDGKPDLVIPIIGWAVRANGVTEAIVADGDCGVLFDAPTGSDTSASRLLAPGEE